MENTPIFEAMQTRIWAQLTAGLHDINQASEKERVPVMLHGCVARAQKAFGLAVYEGQTAIGTFWGTYPEGTPNMHAYFYEFAYARLMLEFANHYTACATEYALQEPGRKTEFEFACQDGHTRDFLQRVLTTALEYAPVKGMRDITNRRAAARFVDEMEHEYATANILKSF